MARFYSPPGAFTTGARIPGAEGQEEMYAELGRSRWVVLMIPRTPHPTTPLTMIALVRTALLSYALLAGLAATPLRAQAAEEPTPDTSSAAVPYDPLWLPTPSAVEVVDRDAQDAARERNLPLRLFLPAAQEPAPVVLFSHGLGGSRRGGRYLGEHWAARGYLAVFLQHPGSDESVWKDLPVRERMASMQRAASATNLLLRVQDVAVVLDLLERWNADEDDPLHARLDLERVGMSGHSFGAVTTQSVGGQSAGGRFGRRFADERIRAAVSMSPSIPRRLDPAVACGEVTIPWLLMTGTHDESLIGTQTPASRRLVYPALPESIDRYELVLHGAEHSAFTERALPGERMARNPNHHRVVLALSTAFWDTHLRQNPAARAWLHGTAVSSLLEEGDRWQLAAATTASESEDEQ